MIVEQARKRRTAFSLLPFFVDGLAIVAAFFLLPSLAVRLARPSGLNALLVVVSYVLFCFAVFLIRKMRATSGPGGWHPPKVLLDVRVRGLLAFIFGLLMVTTVAYQLGYFASIQSIQSAGLDEGNSSSLFVYMPGALLGFSMLYILVLAFPVQESVPPDGNKITLFTLLALGIVNGMLLLCAGQAAALFIDLNFELSIWTWLLLLVGLLISFAPPRILFQDKFPYATNTLSFSILLIILSWLVMRTL